MAGLPLITANEVYEPTLPVLSTVTGVSQLVPLASSARTYLRFWVPLPLT
jgi:hypothetical protein